MKTRIIIISVVAVAVVLAAVYFLVGRNDGTSGPLQKVRIERGTIVDKALAVGTIEPENEISVKSKISGVVSRIYTDVGTFIRAGQPLLEVRPDPTPLELAEAKRQVELRQVDYDNVAKEKTRQESLFKSNLISPKEYEEFSRKHAETELQLKIARERLALIESGRVTIGDTQIESIIKAPIDGFVLSRSVEVGDPVTPLTSFQEGTVLMRMANMERLLFKGTVDEIDVGRLREGLETEIKVGALPQDTIRGVLRKIWLKAQKKENATVFPIEITIPSTKNAVLRAGYSANANIIIQKKTDVLMVPERVITFRNDSAFVKFPIPPDREEERYIKTGLSNAINVEVVSGLNEGDVVLEKPVKKIE